MGPLAVPWKGIDDLKKLLDEVTVLLDQFHI